MKFSVIVPVYNVEQYVKKCLESLNDQTYKNFEAIIIDDGSTDDSVKIIKKFIEQKENFSYYKKKNGGLSDARNFGLKHVTGDYILFLDSDDYYSNDLLFNLNGLLDNNPIDVIKFNINIIKGNEQRNMRINPFDNLNSDEAIPYILKDEMLESACIYCYKTEFWQKHNFKYAKGKIHEDFGLTPLILMEANKISSINFAGYNYVIRENSIMTSSNNQKNYQKYQDCLYFCKENILKIKNCKNINDHTKQLLCSFYVNGVINRLKLLSKEDYEKELKNLQNDKLFDYLIADSLKHKIKKSCYKFLPFIFIKREK